VCAANLRLSATLLGFNVDPASGDALDALMMVDITRLHAAAALLARHRAQRQGSSVAA
jgi:hypothetical protein